MKVNTSSTLLICYLIGTELLENNFEILDKNNHYLKYW